ncbi:MAG: carotenoid oxygenase family protein [Acidimicrobiales bacterium]
MSVATGNMYLDDNFAPVCEEVTALDLPFTGTIPEHLNGRYLRNGPNPLGDVDPATYHWFMGAGMVHGVRIRDGKAEWYRNRWVRSSDVASALGEPAHSGPLFGDDFASNTNVIEQAGRTFAIVEAGSHPYELTDELDTIAPSDFDGTLPGAYAAHPKRDPKTGELHAVSYFWGWGNKVQYSVVGTDARARRTVDIEVTGSPMMHDFSLTEHHVVLYDLPVVFDVNRAMQAAPPPLRRPIGAVTRRVLAKHSLPDRLTGALMRSGDASDMGLPYRWDSNYPARVGVMPRDGGAADFRWFDIEPCYVFHPMNAYDDGDRIVLDVIRHPSMFATDLNGPNEGPTTLDRWSIDLSAGKVIEERLDDESQEFPRVDERSVGRRNRFGYSVGLGGAIMPSGRLLRHDMETGTATAREFGPGRLPGEFVFVPTGDDASEGDGVLMGYVYDQASDKSDLVMLDAGSLETVAEVHLPARVPYGFHGNWMPTAG